MAEEALLRSRLFEQHNIIGLFTQRSGGVSPQPFDSFNFGSGLGDSECNIEKNLKVLVEICGLPNRPHQAKQVHGTNSQLFVGPGCIHPDEADILISNQQGTALGARTADCLPVLLADPEAGIIAAVHAGWRGTAASVVCRGVAEMIKLGASKGKIIASLGPCIGPCCFKVGEEAADQLSNCCKGAETCISRSSDLHADIRSINRLQLLQCGLHESHIESFDACTACHPKHYYSYRRDGDKSGRHLGVVALPANT
ncbi:hypothetical protein Ga0123461_1645 [Mariprofundus aestuarium]|uniref:Purine nucleoside phosphorylase n=1 Tax=Mariprofundus aestuarium TaxID=1921086 RepID=A0A2K8KYK1_MARES|nr:peptidoglycan editing factor PgeF [Mariprofundus aestuarium]ATX80058.1 hypothetical protein Ga0123461_1645 [Mariprofundus aestuarium]